MDIVYTVRPGYKNEELRYSLRSLKNLPHDKVVIVGYKPPWVKDVLYIQTDQPDTLKYKNTTDNIIQACLDDRVSEDFILMNDDFYILKPIKELEHYNRGPIEAVIDYYMNSDIYGEGMRQTYNYLKSLGYHDILSYELHLPMVINKKNFLAMIKRQRAEAPHIEVLHKRTLYGNMFNYGGQSIKDVKVTKYMDKRFNRDATFLSTNDDRFNGKTPIGEFIMELFPEKSPYDAR